MNVFSNKTLLVLAGLTIGLAAHAQTLMGTIQIQGGNGETRQLIRPADSTTGTARALPSIVMPVMPGNLCTSTNNNCVTAANLGDTVLPLIPSQGSSVIPYSYTDHGSITNRINQGTATYMLDGAVAIVTMSGATGQNAVNQSGPSLEDNAGQIYYLPYYSNCSVGVSDCTSKFNIVPGRLPQRLFVYSQGTSSQSGS